MLLRTRTIPEHDRALTTELLSYISHMHWHSPFLQRARTLTFFWLRDLLHGRGILANQDPEMTC